MANSKDKTEEVKNWDTITIFLLVISALILIFSFVAPALFVGKAISPKVDFSQTGPIGDTIGGIMNPFIALVGILLTFLAFYMQIKANQIQKKLFLDGLKAEKKREDDLEKKDALYKLSLLNADLEIILSDIVSKGDKIKSYFESERSKPYDANLLFRTPSKKYTRILDLDRLSIYKGFKLFLSTDEKWIKAFNNLYNSLDYLPMFFEEVYKIYDNHSAIKLDKKTRVTDLLLKFNDMGSQLLTAYNIQFNGVDYLDYPASSCVNVAMTKYYEIIGENYDENGNFISETDYDRFSNDMLLPFITRVLEQRAVPSTFDRRLEPIAQLASEIRKKINLIKQESLWFANNVEQQYNSLLVNKDDFKCTYTVIKEIQEFITIGLKEIET